jgi:hypothetical protein
MKKAVGITSLKKDRTVLLPVLIALMKSVMLLRTVSV